MLGSAWPLLHGLVHLAEWLEHGLPVGIVLAAEIGGIIVPLVIGIALAFTANKAPQTSVN
jgi:hypothetical protein